MNWRVADGSTKKDLKNASLLTKSYLKHHINRVWNPIEKVWDFIFEFVLHSSEKYIMAFEGRFYTSIYMDVDVYKYTQTNIPERFFNLRKNAEEIYV